MPATAKAVPMPCVAALSTSSRTRLPASKTVISSSLAALSRASHIWKPRKLFWRSSSASRAPRAPCCNNSTKGAPPLFPRPHPLSRTERRLLELATALATAAAPSGPIAWSEMSRFSRWRHGSRPRMWAATSPPEGPRLALDRSKERNCGQPACILGSSKTSARVCKSKSPKGRESLWRLIFSISVPRYNHAITSAEGVTWFTLQESRYFKRARLRALGDGVAVGGPLPSPSSPARRTGAPASRGLQSNAPAKSTSNNRANQGAPMATMSAHKGTMRAPRTP
mmetsp:Transcript_50181/g.109480  ORF Transcript_50181/g.109480 Transcript_50181/m.109480 type:complete len:282 (+) Transcript_50181:549-1394(+)